MIIDILKIENFRNIKKININNFEKVNFFIGDNAQGKTNIIESIYVTCFLKSFRTKTISDLINIKSESSNIEVDVLNNNVSNIIKLHISKSNKNLTVNSKKNTNYNYLNTIIFYPDEVNHISNYPIFRRNLIDRSIFYTDYDYIKTYKKYNRCLKQRNIFLKNNNNGNDVWINQLIFYGSEIIKRRIDFINRINQIFLNYDFIFEKNEKYFLKYESKYEKSISVEDVLWEEFSRNSKREIQLGYTLVGPHKDDIYFLLNGHLAQNFASQGQKRSMVISFKTAQILDYKTFQGHYPILILDDMKSELDEKREKALLENLLENSGQVFITSTDFKKIDLEKNLEHLESIMARSALLTK